MFAAEEEGGGEGEEGEGGGFRGGDGVGAVDGVRGPAPEILFRTKLPSRRVLPLRVRVAKSTYALPAAVAVVDK
jgi:hypothetical protein